MNMTEISGGTPDGASTMAEADGSRQPTESNLAIARFWAAHVARIAQRLHAKQPAGSTGGLRWRMC
jgi:hypothetical protein